MPPCEVKAGEVEAQEGSARSTDLSRILLIQLMGCLFYKDYLRLIVSSFHRFLLVLIQTIAACDDSVYVLSPGMTIVTLNRASIFAKESVLEVMLISLILALDVSQL